jgi:hypothetical protein
VYPAYQPAYRQPVPFPPQPVWPAPAPYPVRPSYPVRRSAPASVHILAFLFYLGMLVFALAAGTVGVVTATGQLPTDQVAGYAAADELTVGGIVLASVLGVVALIHLLLGRALQRGRQWARVLLLVFAVLGLLGAGADVFLEGTVSLTATSLVGPVLTIVLLNTRAARSWFRYGTY